MSATTKGRSLLPKSIQEGSTFFACLLDNSRSMYQTKLANGQSLFEMQVQEVNTFLTALTRSRHAQKTQVLLVTLHGVAFHGWRFIREIPVLDVESFRESSCSPIDDVLKGIASLMKSIKEESTTRGVNVNGCIYIVTDGLDGITIAGKPQRVSVTPVQNVASAIEEVALHGFSSHALACDESGGADLKAALQQRGVPSEHIFTSGLDESQLRKQFNVLSLSSLGGLL